MDLTRIAQQVPWLWPPDIDSTLLALLRDRQAAELERLQAAEMAGEGAIINDDLAGALLSVVGDANASEELRTRAALSLGPVLEEMDTDSFGDLPGLDEDSFDSPPNGSTGDPKTVATLTWSGGGRCCRGLHGIQSLYCRNLYTGVQPAGS